MSHSKLLFEKLQGLMDEGAVPEAQQAMALKVLSTKAAVVAQELRQFQDMSNRLASELKNDEFRLDLSSEIDRFTQFSSWVGKMQKVWATAPPKDTRFKRRGVSYGGFD